jgi:two-component system sensor histidine kinase BarA
LEPIYELLAVDDNELNLGLFRLFLTQLGHTVTSVNNPFDAIDLVGQNHFDMVFTDIQMPGMSGIEAAAKMRKDGFQGPIIAITAHLSNVEEDKLTESNINGFLIKPVAKQDLVTVLREHLGDESSQPSTTRVEETVPRVHPDKKSGSIYDLGVALERANQSPELATEMMQLLAESLEYALPIVSPENSGALSEQLHKLSGGVRYTGAVSLEAILDATRLQPSDGSLKNIEAIEVEIQRVIEWIKSTPEPFKLD